MLKVIEVALAEVGYHEGANNYNKFADELIDWYGWYIQNQPWCDIYIHGCFKKAYGIELASKLLCEHIGSASASCAVSMKHFQDAGRFSFDNPQVGDQVFFGPGGSSHTGLVISVNGNSFETVEGNTSDQVMKRSHSVGDGYTYGFGHPDYSLVDEFVDTSESSISSDPDKLADNTMFAIVCLAPELHKGDKGYYVQVMQMLLVLKGYAPDNTIRKNGTADGEFGDGTETALNKFKAAKNLPSDGVCDPQTFAELFNK